MYDACRQPKSGNLRIGVCLAHNDQLEFKNFTGPDAVLEYLTHHLTQVLVWDEASFREEALHAAQRVRVHSTLPFLFLIDQNWTPIQLDRLLEIDGTDFLLQPVNSAYLRSKVTSLQRLTQRFPPTSRGDMPATFDLHSRVLQSMNEGVSLTDEDGVILYTNPAEDRIFGYGPGELVGKHVSVQNAMPPAENARKVAEVIAQLQSHGVWLGEWCNRRKDGSIFYTRAHITALDSGEKKHWVCVQTDITKERQASEALQTSEERFRSLAEAMPQLVWTGTPSGRIDYINRQSQDYFGIEPTRSFDIEDWMEAVHPDERTSALDLWRTSVATGNIFECQYRMRRGDGVYRWFLARALPVRMPGGMIRGWLGTATDIEEQKQAEESQRFLAVATDILTSSLDYRSRLDQVAQLAVKRFGGWCLIHTLDGDGQLLPEAIANADAEQVERAWEFEKRYKLRMDLDSGPALVIRSGKPILVPWITDEMLRASAEDETHLEALRAAQMRSYMCLPLTSRRGTFGTVIMVSHTRSFEPSDFTVAEELTHRFAYALENARLYREAQTAIEARDNLLSVTSHELRTPITSIKLQLQMARRSLETNSGDPERFLKALDISITQIRRLNDLIEDLLNFSQVASGNLQYRFEDCDLSALASESLERFAEQFEGAKCEVRAAITPGVRAFCDPMRIDQVLINLMTNALKYGPGNPIQISVDARDGQAMFEIRDQGIGIPRDKLGKIFNRFERAVSSTNVSGFGLGLFVTKSIVDAHGGRIEVESGVGRGSTFRMFLPQTPTADRSIEIRGSQKPS